MNLEKLETQLRSLVENIDEDSFIFDLLRAYELPKASITRLKKGDYNLAKSDDKVLWKKKLYFEVEKRRDLHDLIDHRKAEQKITKHHPRFILVTDFTSLLSIDTKTGDTLDIPLKELAKHYDFFLPWAGMEKAQLQSENPADIKAAERMGRLYDIILEDNPTETDAERHALNIFLSRLLFCFFAEDTGIFEDDEFTNALASHTATDGSDLQVYLQRLFKVLNLKERDDFPKYLQNFPYVNGGLFADEYPVPNFTARSRKIILECGALNWKEINPDIFGSMMQAVVHTSQRGELGMHYTSVVNIMKVIEPLFLNDLWEEFEKAGKSQTKLRKLLARIEKLRIFDPACGSGNFLIIAYKELCRLEIEVFKKLYGGQRHVGSVRSLSNITLSQFYGIELDDFAHETAKLSLWLAEHQMNLAFKEVFGDARPTLPLTDGGNIVCGNATRMNWERVCPKDVGYEIYILGNPPYLGGKRLNKDQREDMSFAGLDKMRQLDYVGCWFVKAARYIQNTTNKYAFVSTSSICQGEQVHLLWSYIFNKKLELFYAYQPFPWSNNAKNNAGVVCTVVGVSPVSVSQKKYIISNDSIKRVQDISPYLIEGPSIMVVPETKPINRLPVMCMGSNPVDGKKLVVSSREYEKVISTYPHADKYLKRYMGGNDFMSGVERYCIWIEDDEINSALEIPLIKERVQQCKEYRAGAGRDARKVADRPHRFCYRKHQNVPAIIFPKTSSSGREYIPCGITDENTVVNVDALVIYNAEPYVMSILSSKMHMVWLAAVTGRLGTGIRYSVKLCYNTLPLPKLTSEQKEQLENCAFKILDERELYSEKTIAQLYESGKMPSRLSEAHLELDETLERCYQKKSFDNDTERLELLFKLYAESKNA